MIDEAALLALEGRVDMAIYGVDAIVTQPGVDEPVLARAFWVAMPASDNVPFGIDAIRMATRRVLVFRKLGDRLDGEPLVFPKGTAITAPIVTGQPDLDWLADGPDRIDETYHYVVVVPVREETS